MMKESDDGEVLKERRCGSYFTKSKPITAPLENLKPLSPRYWNIVKFSEFPLNFSKTS